MSCEPPQLLDERRRDATRRVDAGHRAVALEQALPVLHDPRAGLVTRLVLLQALCDAPVLAVPRLQFIERRRGRAHGLGTLALLELALRVLLALGRRRHHKRAPVQSVLDL